MKKRPDVEYQPYPSVPAVPILPHPGAHMAVWFPRGGWFIGEVAEVHEGECDVHDQLHANDSESDSDSPAWYFVCVQFFGGEQCWIQFYANGNSDTDRYVVLYAAAIAASVDLCTKPGSKSTKKKPPRGGGPGGGSTSKAALPTATKRKRG